MLPYTANDPHEAFEAWFSEARGSEPDVPDAMQIATVADGQPSLRTVLLKEWGPAGWVFYTNLGSQKGRELADHPRLAGLLHWKSLERQVRITGVAEAVDAATADRYFSSRPRGSRIGAWASRQSEVTTQEALVARVAEIEASFAGREVPRPPFWGGFRIAIDTMEFWQGRRDRLHDRVRFRRDGDGWARERLCP